MNGKVAGEVVHQLCLQGIVGEIRVQHSLRDLPKGVSAGSGLIGTACIKASSRCGATGLINRRVGIDIDWEMAANAADVGNFNTPIGCELLLHTEGELLHGGDIMGARFQPEDGGTRREDGGGGIWIVGEGASPGPIGVDQAGRLVDGDASNMQMPDGNIGSAYTFRRETIKFVEFDENWIKKGGTQGNFKGG